MYIDPEAARSEPNTRHIGKCECKLHLGFNSLTTSSEVPNEDPLIQKLQGVPLKFQPANGEEAHDDNIMTILQREISRNYLAGAEDHVISLPPDPQPEIKRVKSTNHYQTHYRGVYNNDPAKQDTKTLNSKRAEDYVHILFTKSLENWKPKQPAFIIMNYKTESYFLYVRTQGLENREEKAKISSRDIRLRPLDELEICYIDALGLNLHEASQYYSPAVQLFMSTDPARAKNLVRKLLKLMNERCGWETIQDEAEKEKYYTEDLGVDSSDLSQFSSLVHLILSKDRSQQDFSNVSYYAKDFLANLVNLDNREWVKILAQMESAEEVKNLTRSLFYQTVVEDSSLEMDTLIVLPASRLIIDIEVKSADNDTKNVDSKLKEASRQTGRRNRLLGLMHADILSSDWSYVRAIALPLVPSLEEWEKIQSLEKNQKIKSSSGVMGCHNCRQFILDQTLLDSPGDWLAWVTKHGRQEYQALFKEAPAKDWPEGRPPPGGLAPASNTIEAGAQPMPEDPSTDSLGEDRQYYNLLGRILGFLSIANCTPPFSRVPAHQRKEGNRMLNEEAVTGQSRGVTSEYPSQDDVKSMQGGKGKKGSGAYLGSVRSVIMWNKEQAAVLQRDELKLIFDADFGCGKTLLLKSKALHLAVKYKSCEEKVDIVFVSVSAAISQRYDEVWREEKVIELANKQEFEGTGVKALSLRDVLKLYEKVHGKGKADRKQKKFRMLERLLNFLVEKMYPRAHIFIDEIPVIWGEAYHGITIKGNPDVYTWMAFRPALLNSSFPKRGAAAAGMKNLEKVRSSRDYLFYSLFC